MLKIFCRVLLWLIDRQLKNPELTDKSRESLLKDRADIKKTLMELRNARHRKEPKK